MLRLGGYQTTVFNVIALLHSVPIKRYSLYYPTENSTHRGGGGLSKNGFKIIDPENIYGLICMKICRLNHCSSLYLIYYFRLIDYFYNIILLVSYMLCN